MTYDFRELGLMYHLIREEGFGMVIGNRFAGGIERGAMSLDHKIGVRFLSWFGRMRYKTDIRDFHSGARGMSREAAKELLPMFCTEGMEFATEMIAMAQKKRIKIGQMPIRLYRCTKERKSKLHTIRDGFRHLGFMICGFGKGKIQN